MKTTMSFLRNNLQGLILAVIVSSILQLNVSAQNKTGQDYEIVWANGDMTTLRDLGKVWITLKKGSDVKNVRVWEIQPENSIVVYEQNGTLHDLMMAKIAYIGSGKFSQSRLYFDQHGVPIIKSNPEYIYSFDTYTNFKVTRKAVKVEETGSENTGTVSTPDPVKNPSLSTSNQLVENMPACDTIMRPDGEVLLIKVIIINATEIRYRRLDIPEGPVYSINNTPETKVITYPKGFKIIQK